MANMNRKETPAGLMGTGAQAGHQGAGRSLYEISKELGAAATPGPNQAFMNAGQANLVSQSPRNTTVNQRGENSR